jgi:hypothetical protein
VSVLCAVDLDRTLIYSRRALGDVPGAMAAERRDGADVSWLAAGAAADLRRLRQVAHLVPVTTRTPAQYGRVMLPGGPPRYAVCANGGVLQVDGRVDHAWADRVGAELARVAPLREVWERACRICRPEWTDTLRNADGLFCYAVVRLERLPAGLVAEAAAWAATRGWRVSLQGRKLYWVPAPLRKSAAVAEIARRERITTVLAAGDSLLDDDLLEYADAGIAARHGELVAGGWRAAHVRITESTGGAAGAEIVAWLLAAAERG